MGQILDLSISDKARAVAEKLTAELPEKFPSMKAAVSFLADAGVTYLEEITVLQVTPINSEEPDGRAINDEIAGPEARSDAKGADFQIKPHATDTDFDVTA